MRKTLRTRLQGLKFTPGFPAYAITLLAVMAGAYLLQAGKMGFYYDDWEGVFLYQQGFSAAQVWEYFLVDRPFSSLVHWIFHPLAGVSPLAWNVLAALLHWAGILFFVKSLLKMFPGQTLAAGWVGFLLALYPGITRHFVPRTSTPHYFSFFLFALSLWLMFKAHQSSKRRVPLLAASIACALLQVLVIEYFATMEIARGLLLLYFFYGQEKNRRNWRQKALQAWIPYAIVFLIFLVFKFQILPALAQADRLHPKHSISLWQEFSSAPIETLIAYANLVVQDMVYAVFYVWTLPFAPTEIDLASKTTLASWGLGALLAGIGASVLWDWQAKEGSPKAPDTRSVKIAVVLCIITALLGGLPAWLLGRQAVTGTWSNRFLFAQVLGAVPLAVILSIVIAGYSRRHIANTLLAILLMASFSFQFREAKKYTIYWSNQQNFYWQLKWRAPGLMPKTFIVSPNTPVQRTTDYQIAYVINMLYAPGRAQEASLYWWFNGPEALWDFNNQKYHPTKDIYADLRTIYFESNMRFALPVLSKPARGCVQVLTDDYYKGEPELSDEEMRLFALAHNGLIESQGPSMLPPFQKEPPHTWCYYYQKAELARQNGDWEQILNLWQALSAQGYASTYGPEYLPFIEAHARANDWISARKITIKAGQATKSARPFLCNFWLKRLQPFAPNGEFLAEWNKLKDNLECP